MTSTQNEKELTPWESSGSIEISGHPLQWWSRGKKPELIVGNAAALIVPNPREWRRNTRELDRQTQHSQDFAEELKRKAEDSCLTPTFQFSHTLIYTRNIASRECGKYNFHISLQKGDEMEMHCANSHYPSYSNASEWPDEGDLVRHHSYLPSSPVILWGVCRS